MKNFDIIGFSFEKSEKLGMNLISFGSMAAAISLFISVVGLSILSNSRKWFGEIDQDGIRQTGYIMDVYREFGSKLVTKINLKGE